MPVPLFESICHAAEAGQVLDITLRGGEPSLHPQFVECVRWAWKTFPFGISVTTNCTHVRPLLDATDYLSAIRNSIDPYKRQFVESLRQNTITLNKSFKVGINLPFHPNHGAWATDTVVALASEGISDILFLPEHSGGQYSFSQDAWIELSRVVRFAESIGCRVKVTDLASRFIPGPFLATNHPSEFVFAHVNQRGGICRRSWEPAVALAATSGDLLILLQAIHPLRETYENLA